jgi:predicted metal-dependent phosphoesterase TrpH
MTRGMVRVDLHVHSSASRDCGVPPHRVAARCRALGLGPVFLTDHDTIAGALELWRQDPARAVVGQELMTTEGEIIGLFLERQIPRGLTPEEAILQIRAQGGLVYLQHPYDPYRRRLREDAIERLADRFDIVEVFNGRADDEANRRAADLCAILDAVPGAGSDAHTVEELGGVYVEMEPFDGPDDFLARLRRGRIVVRPSRVRLAVEAALGPALRR